MLKDQSLISGSARLTRTILACITVIFTLHIINILLGKPSYNFDRLVHFDHEGNLPTWFSSALWATGAVIAYLCAQLAEVKFEKRIWFLFALVLLILSIDEVAMLHEHIFGMMIGKVIRKFTGSHGWLKWPVIASPVILFLIYYFGTNLRKCLVGSKRCAVYLIAGVVLLIFSAGVLEIIHYYIGENSNLMLEIEITLEELGEMMSAFLIICGLLAHRKVLEQRFQS